MKSLTSRLLIAASVLASLASFSIEAHAEGKATICYDDAHKLAQTLAKEKGVRVGEGQLGSFDNVEGAQVEGWSFPIQGHGAIVILGIADGLSQNGECSLSVVYSTLRR